LRFAQEEDARQARSADERAGAAHRRADGVAPAAPTACARGCAFCCHLLVNVTPSEAAVLAARVPDDRREVVLANASRARGLSPGAYRRARIRCAFLDDNDECTVYDVRPLACRAHTSASRDTCERVFRGGLPGGAVPTDPWLTRAVAAIRVGMGEGDGEELHAALARAFRAGD
jgi:Fe-S-cluster containining protein